MKKVSRFVAVFVLVFTLLLSCSGGLVAKAAYGSSIDFNSCTELDISIDKVSMSDITYNNITYGFPDEVLNFVNTNALDTFFVTRYSFGDISYIHVVIYKDDVTTIKYSNANGSNYTQDYIQWDSNDEFCYLTYIAGDEGLSLDSCLTKITYYEIRNYRVDKNLASSVCSEENLLDLASRAIIYSSNDLVVEMYSCVGTCFFHLSQPELGLDQQVIAQILEQTNPLQEILLLIPVTIACLVGYVGLRKALNRLVRILRRA